MWKVKDIEWKFGVTAATSEESQVGTTYLHLKIKYETENGELRSTYVELSLPQFYEFLHLLEKAKDSLDYF